MELSIDLKYLQQISFNDKAILKSMLEEWLKDTEFRIAEFEKILATEDSKKKFNLIHTLKTNFFMIGCQPMIKLCEDYLNSDMNLIDSNNVLINVTLSMPELKNQIRI